MARESVRRRGRKPAGPKQFNQLPWRRIDSPYAPIEVLSEEGILAITETAFRILEEIGMDFLHPEALEILRLGGAEVEDGSERVRFDRGLIREAIAKAPTSFEIHARNPAHSLFMGGRRINFASVASAPNVSDLTGGRRPGNQQDYRDFLRLGQMLNIVHLFGGYPVEPVDLPPATRHLDCIRDFITLTDKVYHAYSLGRTRVLDALEELSRRNQLVVVTPFTLSGAMSPATIAGALAQQHAEAMATIALTQLVRPGAPVMYGGFTSNVDMKSGAPAFGTPEYTRAALAGGQLARSLGVPYRSSNANASNVVDGQAAYESQMSLWGAVMGHANMIMHGAGWLEGGLVASFEKFLIDAEMLQMMAETLYPLEVSEAALGFDAVKEVGPGGHFFGAAHTLERYENAFYAPILSDWRNFESWAEAGSRTVTERAHALSKELLGSYEKPPLDAAVGEELDAFVERRRAEGGASDV
jgi:trimethylamine--corrinoid protein Co-methyltransferase